MAAFDPESAAAICIWDIHACRVPDTFSDNSVDRPGIPPLRLCMVCRQTGSFGTRSPWFRTVSHNLAISRFGTTIRHLLEALREGEISIHRASIWVENPEKQLDQLRLYQNRRGITRAIRSLQRRHRLPHPANEGRFDIQRIASALMAMNSEKNHSVLVSEIQLPGHALLLSSGLLKALESQAELQL